MTTAKMNAEMMQLANEIEGSYSDHFTKDIILNVIERKMIVTALHLASEQLTAGGERNQDQIDRAILKFAQNYKGGMTRLTYDFGPYEITQVTRFARDFADAILALSTPTAPAEGDVRKALYVLRNIRNCPDNCPECQKLAREALAALQSQEPTPWPMT